MIKIQKISNLEEFKETILKYESITKKDVMNSESYQRSMSPPDEKWSAVFVMKELTGFGTIGCKLCSATRSNKLHLTKCEDCTWIKETGHKCYQGPNANTYENFKETEIESEEGLVEACELRAEYMRDVIQWYDKEI